MPDLTIFFQLSPAFEQVLLAISLQYEKNLQQQSDIQRYKGNETKRLMQEWTCSTEMVDTGTCH